MLTVNKSTLTRYSGIVLCSGVVANPAPRCKKHSCAPFQQKLQGLKRKIGAKMWKKQKQNFYC